MSAAALPVEIPGAQAEPPDSRDGEPPSKQPRRRACNECKQQKLRCDLVANTAVSSVCSRCQRLQLTCKIDNGFRRTRKRRKSFELENEVRELRRRLATREASSNAVIEWPTIAPAAPSETRASDAIQSSASNASGPSLDPKESSRVPGLTTQPVIDQPQAPRRSIIAIPRPRKLGNVELSVEEIDELYLISSTADPTYMLAGMMVQLGTQMGLHRALSAEDFVKVPLHLSMYEFSEWIKTWESCNIVAQSVSVGCGLPATIQMQDWSLTVAPESATLSLHDVALRWHLRIEQFRHKVSQALTSNALDPAGFMSIRERLSLYRLLNASLVDLEREAINMTPFIILKVMMNGYFEKLLDVASGKKLLDAAISSLRKMSVANNDLPGRLSDVIGFFCTLTDPRVISGESVDDLRLRVRNRLSMSIVYDSLWEWRKHFQSDGNRDENSAEAQDKWKKPY
ncbi:hypothetical protein ACSS6W_008032 [Trichoderma asperelloides]